jgi:hypothetical protein
MDVIERYHTLIERREDLNLYALVDALVYEQHCGQRLTPSTSHRALFAGTPDEPLAHAGPWLVDAKNAQQHLAALFALETAKPALSWIITAMDFEGLFQFLQLQQNVQLPGGQTALLRLADPRVLAQLFEVMSEAQRQQLFGLIHEWHFMKEGQRVWTGNHHA